MKAVKNRRVFAIPNTKIVASAIHTVETMRLIRQGLYPDLPAER
jgi:ABC-type Fe3+-hydroxamate transport system substrate-binding protein